PDFCDVGLVWKDARRQRAVDRRERHLEAQVPGQRALLPHRLEHEIGVDGIAGVADAPADVAETDALDAVLDLEPPRIRGIARMKPLDAILRRRPLHRFKLRMSRQDLIVDPADPMLARADLAIWHGLERSAE